MALYFPTGCPGQGAGVQKQNSVRLNFMFFCYRPSNRFCNLVKEICPPWINLLDECQPLLASRDDRKRSARHSAQNWMRSLCRCFNILRIMIAPADDD